MQNNTFSQLVEKKDRGLYLYGTIPPRKTVPINQVRKMAEELVNEIEQLGVDALVIYDVQDEAGRSGEDKPFPFSPCVESEYYITLLREYMKNPIECIVYRALPYHARETFADFLQKVSDAKCNAIVLSGAPPKHDELSVLEAADIVRQSAYSLCVGGITLLERHAATSIEHQFVADKVDRGLTFFTSQVVYNADSAITFLQNYDFLCKVNDQRSPRIIFTFAPFGREETASFLRWLGVELPDATMKRVLSKGDPKDCVDEANQICRENLNRILNACTTNGFEIPLGFTCECVSMHREEIEGVANLFLVLRDDMDLYYAKKRLQRSADA